MPENTNTIKFYHGALSDIQSKIDDNIINENDMIITSDTDELIYIDKTKKQIPLGSAKSKKEHTVNLGVGNSLGGLENGAILDPGITLDDLIVKLTQKKVDATYEHPSVSCAVSAGQKEGVYEAGTQIATTITSKFIQNDAGKITNLVINKSGQSGPIASIATDSLTTEEQIFEVPEGTISFSASATYEDGIVKVDNLGESSPKNQIKAGTIKSGNVNFTGQRRFFFGSGVGPTPKIDSAKIRALPNGKLNPQKGDGFAVELNIGDQHAIIAYPSKLGEIKQLQYREQSATNIKPNCVLTKVQVEGANNFTSIEYNVYTYDIGSPAMAEMHLDGIL